MEPVTTNLPTFIPLDDDEIQQVGIHDLSGNYLTSMSNAVRR